jgi:hypothetical protein
VVNSKFKYGAKDYAIGNHPAWEVFRVAYQMTRTPFLVGGVALGAGYFWAMARRVKRPVPQELVAFHRREQLQRLKRFFGLGRQTEVKLSVPNPSDSYL